MKNRALHSPSEAADIVHRNVITSLSPIPGVTKFEVVSVAFSLAVEAGLKNVQMETKTHKQISATTLRSAGEELKGFRVTKVDENPGSVWVLCPVLRANLFQKHLLGAPGYRIHQCHESPLQAYAPIMLLIDEKRTEYKIPHTWQSSTTLRGKRVK